jgi:hypothetical protein
MLLQKVAQKVHTDALAHLAEHPSDGLVHEVVRVVEVHLGITETPRWVALLGSLPIADHADALFPEAGAMSQRVKHLLLVFLMQSCCFASQAGGE